GLADAGKHDPRTRYAGTQRLLEFAARHHIGAGPETRQRLEHRAIAPRLDGEGDERILRKCGREDAIVPLQRRAGIAVERRANRLGQRVQIDIFGMKDAAAIAEIVHSPCCCWMGGLEGSFWPRGVGLPSGMTRSLFTPQPARASASAMARAMRRLISASPARNAAARAHDRARCRRNSCAPSPRLRASAR